ncbi:defensin-like protein 1 [Malania oleifera]|uniref:defensin-like protein 1 n=1 Tax=Malania oleifera TaxID=397392 RepID=UPI0025ADBA6A|nr:defensin-like protein 1 [Malania oleifera]
MDSNSKFFVHGFIFLLLLCSFREAVVEVEGRTCESQSRRFDGVCVRDNSCAMVCRVLEGYEGGHCRGFRHRCFCTKRC